MDYETLERFRRRLYLRRASLLQRREQTLAEEQALLAEREPDWADAASRETEAALLESLGEAERQALLRIQTSLDRMQRGRYGECAVCRGTIDDERLLSVPDTDRCGGCAAAH